MEFVKKNALGILVCLVIAVPAWLLGQRFEVVGGPVFAILIGMVIALFWKDQKAAKSGITYTSKKILQLAVVLLGFGMNLGSVLQVGGQSLPIIVSTIATSLIVAFVLYKALHMDANISTLIGVGSSICGGSAIAATAPVIGADDEEIAQAISVIFLFNVIAALILHKTKFGRYTFAIGSNEEAARLSGINVDAWKVGVYTLSGFFVGIAGLMYAAAYTTITPGTGNGQEMNGITGVVIGGTSMSGGSGSMAGTLIGVFIMSVLKNGLSACGLQAPWQTFFTGLVVIGAVLLDIQRTKAANRVKKS